MAKTLTPKQRKALQILKDHPDITARAFALFYDKPAREPTVSIVG